MATNIECFDLLTGRIFADLYDDFPVARVLTAEIYCSYLLGIDPENPIEAVMDDQGKAIEFYFATVEWLEVAGYIRHRHENSDWSETVLTAKGLESLKSVPDSLAGKESLGSQLIDAARDGATTRLKDLASSVIGVGVQLSIGAVQAVLAR
ncbi:hypothetical protein OMP44_11005 [Pseudomonas sp. CBMAI 2609]|uniref:DUF2513 domain-containing protein n=1 Tax=Pseudomonas flavocrustae TaxID=2991719 RepID=A0ABT6IHU8_9PSED|nr:hypothetical protein [Pseudomonas sp. CBMAI 2609]MDH4763425.1 hypothetical protein [Pseudomonas sp. CBMAI 2609]